MPTVFKMADGTVIPLKNVNFKDVIGAPLAIKKVYWKDASGDVSEVMGSGVLETLTFIMAGYSGTNTTPVQAFDIRAMQVTSTCNGRLRNPQLNCDMLCCPQFKVGIVTEVLGATPVYLDNTGLFKNLPAYPVAGDEWSSLHTSGVISQKYGILVTFPSKGDGDFLNFYDLSSGDPVLIKTSKVPAFSYQKYRYRIAWLEFFSSRYCGMIVGSEYNDDTSQYSTFRIDFKNLSVTAVANGYIANSSPFAASLTDDRYQYRITNATSGVITLSMWDVVSRTQVAFINLVGTHGTEFVSAETSQNFAHISEEEFCFFGAVCKSDLTSVRYLKNGRLSKHGIVNQNGEIVRAARVSSTMTVKIYDINETLLRTGSFSSPNYDTVKVL